MTAIVKPKITDVGRAAAISAAANSVSIAITHIALGTGVYNSETSGAGMTAMAARTEKVALGAGSVSGTGGMRMLAHYQGWTGTPYNVTEIGFWAGDPDAGGTLFAVFSTTTDVVVTRNLLDYIGSFTLQLAAVLAGSVTVSIDPSATQALVLLALHEQASDPHSQYVKQDGTRAFTGGQAGLTAAPHDNSPKLATTAFVKRQGLSHPASGGLAATAADVSVAVNDLGRWIDMQVNGGILRLPAAASCPIGGAVAVRVTALTGTIAVASGDVLVTMERGNVTSIAVATGDWLILTRNTANTWWVTAQGCRVPVGMSVYMPTLTPPPGFIKINGVQLSRAAYPALWLFAQQSGLVTETQWASGVWGRFSSGDGSTTFRAPDVRGLHIQSFDDGRGLDDASRGWGVYQANGNKAHSHGVTDNGHTHGVNDSGHSHAGSAAAVGNHSHSGTAASAGSHSHIGATSINGQHTHTNGLYSNLLRDPYGGSLTGTDQVGSGAEQPVGVGDAGAMLSAGSHAHNLLIEAAGAHTHTLDIGQGGGHSHAISIGSTAAGIGIYSANAGISLLSEGVSRARPDNINWPMYMRYC